MNHDHNAARLEQQLCAAQEALREKDRQMACLAHDLQQPLHAIRLYAEQLAREPHMAPEFAPKLRQAALALKSLLDDAQLAARAGLPEAAATATSALARRARASTVDLPRLLQELVDQFAPLAAEKHLQLRLRSAPVALQTDAVLLRRILGNLLDNAIAHTARGKVLVTARRLGAAAGVRIDVWDTGCGVAPEQIDAIFSGNGQPPARVAATTARRPGHGLGLLIVRHLADALGAAVQASARAGRGSRFSLILPDEGAAVSATDCAATRKR
ncbi:MAG: HAMP domain-containing histidine kinase [Burkholderiaceae bacterium]|jgi:signal transduction histidine kinase|nr:HAMP domain-containing histidine kinase [Burkholderiaceae bacterium]